MTRLAIDTAGAFIAVALEVGEDIVARVCVRRRTGQASSVAPVVDGVLALAGARATELTELVVGIGPGSFTGIRVGLSWAQGVGRGLGVPVIGVSSALTWHVDCGPGVVVVAATDARKAEVYASAWQGDDPHAALVTAAAWSPAALADELRALAGRGLRLVPRGDGFAAYADLGAALVREGVLAPWPDQPAPDAGQLLVRTRTPAEREALVAPTLEPIYLRASEAEVAEQQRLAATADAQP